MESASDWTMQNTVDGQGEIQFTGADQAGMPSFGFKKPENGESFTGTLFLKNAEFGLDGTAAGSTTASVNAGAMSLAKLNADSSRIELSGGRIELDSLTLTNATLAAGSVDWTNRHTSGWIDMTQGNRDGILTISGKNTLELTGIGSFGDESLLMQDEGGLSTVILANSVVFENNGSVKLDMQDESNQEGGYVRIDGLQQGVAGIYGVGEISYRNGEQEGLFVEAKLYEAQVEKDAELLLSGTAIGVETADGTIVKPSADKSFSASITGEGGLRVENTVYLDREQGGRDPSNPYDFVTDFTGATTIAEGATLVLMQSESLGVEESHTVGVHVQQNGALWINNGTGQYAGTLNVEEGGKIHLLADSVLTLDDRDGSGVVRGQDALEGDGTLSVDAGTLTVKEANRTFMGHAVVGDAEAQQNGTLVLNNAEGLGASEVNVRDSGTLRFDLDNGTSGETAVFDNSLVGSGTVAAENGTVVKIDRAANGSTAFKGTYVAAEGSTIVFAGDENFSELAAEEGKPLEGTAEAVAEKGGVVRVEHEFDGKDDRYWIFAQKVSGSGTLVLSTNRSSTGVTLADVDNQIFFNRTAADHMADEENGFFGTVRLENGRLRLQVTDQDNWTEEALKHATLEVAEGGRLMVSDLEVEDDNPDHLHTHEIGGLAFDGGEVRFGQETALVTGTDEQKPLLHVGTLDVGGAGTIEINVGSAAKLPDASEFEDWMETHQSFMEQDDGQAFIQLAQAEDVLLSDNNGAQIDLKVIAQDEIEAGGITEQLGDHIVEAGTNGEDSLLQLHYGYGVTVAGNDTANADNRGLWISYRLKEVGIYDGQTLVLDPSSDPDTEALGVDAYKFRAKISEVGDAVGHLEIHRIVGLANAENEFSGRTIVNDGARLYAFADNVLGQAEAGKHTSELYLGQNARYELNGYSQVIGSLHLEEGASVNLEARSSNNSETGFGTLVVESGGSTASGDALRGQGTLVLLGGTFTVEGANEDLSGEVHLGGRTYDTAALTDEPVARLTSVDGFGSSDIVFDADETLELKGTNGVFDNSLASTAKGDGVVAATDGADLVIGGDNTGFTGTFSLVEESKAAVGRIESLGGSDEAGWANYVLADGTELSLDIAASYALQNATSGAGDVVIHAGSGNVVEVGSSFAHEGLTHVASGGLKSAGDNAAAGGDESASSDRTTILGDLTIDKGATFEGFAGVNGTVTNGGTIYVNWQRFAQSAATGNKAARKGEDSSIVYGETDEPNRLVIGGDYVGTGGKFVFNGALAYDDSPVDTVLIKGDATGTGSVSVNNLGGQGALTSEHGITLIEIEGDSDLHMSQDGRIVAGAYDYVLLKDPDGRRWYLQSAAGEQPINPEVPVGPLVRPEAGAYMAASASAGWLEMRLHDRAGESHYVDPLSGEVKETSMWMRQTAAHEHFRAYGGDLRTHMTGGVTQIGGDIIRYNDAGDIRGNIGLFGSVLYGESSTRSMLSGNSADTKSDGYSVGLYGTLFTGQGEALDRGGYIDFWAQWAMLNHEIRPEQLEEEKVDADGLIASIEAGWTFQIGTTGKGTASEVNWALQPQAQMIYESAQLDDHVEAGGTRVRMTSDHNIKTRVGFRLQASPAVRDGEHRGQGFLELNWIRNSDPLGVVMNGTTINVEGTKHAGEIRFGFEKELADSLHGWINGGYLAGGSGYHQETVNIGLKYLW